MSYRGSLSPDGYKLTVGGMFGKDPQDESAVRFPDSIHHLKSHSSDTLKSQLYWATRSLIPKDQIFPEVLEIDASGTYLKSLPYVMRNPSRMFDEELVLTVFFPQVRRDAGHCRVRRSCQHEFDGGESGGARKRSRNVDSGNERIYFCFSFCFSRRM